MSYFKWVLFVLVGIGLLFSGIKLGANSNSSNETDLVSNNFYNSESLVFSPNTDFENNYQNLNLSGLSFTEKMRKIRHFNALKNKDWTLLNEKEINIIKIKINTILDHLSVQPNDFYHQLLTPYSNIFDHKNEQLKKMFEQKLIFKLDKLLKKKLRTTFINPLAHKLKLIEIYLEPLIFEISPKEKNYALLLRISLIRDCRLIATWNTSFFWNPVSTKKIADKDIKQEAMQTILQLNKKMFYHTSTFNGQDLFYFIKGKLEELSFNFAINSKTKNMTLALKSIDFKFDVTWKNRIIFNAIVNENASSINYYRNKTINSLALEQERPINSFFTHQEFKNNIENAFRIITLKYHHMWSIYDCVGELTTSAKHFLLQIYGPDIASQISVTSDVDPRTTLKELSLAPEELEPLKFNFTWIVTTPYSIVKYQNLGFRILTLEDQINNFRLWVNNQNIEFDNKFINSQKDLMKFLQSKASTFAYVLSLKVDDEDCLSCSIRDTNFIFEIYENNFSFVNKSNNEQKIKAVISYDYNNHEQRLASYHVQKALVIENLN